MPSLSMPLFVSVDDVILRMQLGSELTGIQDVVESGIIGAQNSVEKITGSTLTRKSWVETFFLDGDAFSGIQPDGVFRVELPSAFVRQDTPPTVEVKSADIAATLSKFGTYGAADPATYEVSYADGYILFDAATYKDSFVRISFDSGFEPGTNPLAVTGLPAYADNTAYALGDKVSYLTVAYECVQATSTTNNPTNTDFWKPATIPMEQIPVDVYEAIMTFVPIVFDSSQVTNRNDQAEKQYNKAADRAGLLLKTYIRAKGFSFRKS